MDELLDFDGLALTSVIVMLGGGSKRF